MNSAASLKAFCGRNGGIVCTSSNAGRVFDWAFERGEKLLFFPDEHLGRNTGVKKGIPPDQMVVWDPFQPLGGNTPEAAAATPRVILWKGYCSVHARFTVEQIEQARRRASRRQRHRPPGVPAGGRAGRRHGRLDRVHHRHDPRRSGGTTWAVGTEINLVNRLDAELPDKHIFCLDPGDLPLLHDVPRPPGLRPLDAGAPGRRQRRQPDHGRPQDRR